MHIVMKVSLAASIVAVVTILAEVVGLLDKKYVDPILYVCLVVQTIFLILVIITFIIIKTRVHGVKIVRYRINDTLVKGDTDIIPEYISPTHPRKSTLFKIFLEVEDIEDPPEFGISKISSEKTPDIKDHIVNINAGIVNNSFIFDADLIVGPGEKINFRLKKDTNIKLFFLGEFYTP